GVSTHPVGNPARTATTYQLDSQWELHVIYDDGDNVAEFSIAHRWRGSESFQVLRAKIGDPELFALLELIHQSPSVRERDVDPVALARAVNALHAVGRERALEAITRYYALPNHRDLQQSSKLDLDAERLFPILGFLFVPLDDE